MKFIAHVRKEGGGRQSLEVHLRGVAQQARVGTEKLGLYIHGELIGLLHDLGCTCQDFQNHLKSAVGLLNQDKDDKYVDAERLKGRIDHSTAGAQMIWNELSKRAALSVKCLRCVLPRIIQV